ncbi:hypothetical protein F4809DRAFT_592913 [Biscogniauxia mediterranea]|nr:hypothetical protein F4809DRAFT_592913 [Biscogniauxia mediterranea]
MHPSTGKLRVRWKAVGYYIVITNLPIFVYMGRSSGQIEIFYAGFHPAVVYRPAGAYTFGRASIAIAIKEPSSHHDTNDASEALVPMRNGGCDSVDFTAIAHPNASESESEDPDGAAQTNCKSYQEEARTASQAKEPRIYLDYLSWLGGIEYFARTPQRL